MPDDVLLRTLTDIRDEQREMRREHREDARVASEARDAMRETLTEVQVSIASMRPRLAILETAFEARSPSQPDLARVVELDAEERANTAKLRSAALKMVAPFVAIVLGVLGTMLATRCSAASATAKPGIGVRP